MRKGTLSIPAIDEFMQLPIWTRLMNEVNSDKMSEYESTRASCVHLCANNTYPRTGEFPFTIIAYYYLLLGVYLCIWHLINAIIFGSQTFFVPTVKFSRIDIRCCYQVYVSAARHPWWRR